MKKSIKLILVSTLFLVGIISAHLISKATTKPFDNLFQEGFAGYTSDEKEVLTTDYISSVHINVSAGENVWFGPCDSAQYFQVVGVDAQGNAATEKIRGKDLEVYDTFHNEMVIYRYKVPAGVTKLCFTAPAGVAPVYAVSKTEFNCLKWDAFWNLSGVDTEPYVGASSYYEVNKGDKVYFGAITEKDALQTVAYDKSANELGIISKSDLRLVESFGGEYGIYCYTVNRSDVHYIQVPYDTDYSQYYTKIQKKATDNTTDQEVVDQFIKKYGIQKPVSATVSALSGKSALFVGDSITYGARDRAKIYRYGGWAGRIGYFCDMDVLNNGVSGACITTARVESHSEQHYIYNNLVAAKNQQFDYVIMHGLFNDASIPVELGSAQGSSKFNPSKADVTKFADALELLFYTAKTQHPEATLGYIVNFHTERAVNQESYAEIAIEICKDWGIKYLDLYNDKTFTVEFDDGLHPSSAGYDSMYIRVANWMATLKTENKPEDTVVSSAQVMSYNVFWNTNDSETGINGRKEKIAGVINANDPDILLLQEVSGGTSGWVPQIKAYAETYGYEYYGYYHKADSGIDSIAGIYANGNGISAEMTPILWKSSKYDCVDRGHFWASSTPDVAGSVWKDVATEAGKDYPRCINWVILKDKTTSEQILVLSYHADPQTTLIRNLSAQLLVEKISQIRSGYENLAVVMGGDWNMQRKDVAYSTVVGNGYGDAQKEAANTTSQGSYNAWTREPTKFGFGDYIFANEDVVLQTYKVYDDKDSASGKYLSDHSPIIANIQY